MKLVKEILYEKFVEDSDPVFDLGIGFPNMIKNAHEVIFKEDDKNVFLIIDPWTLPRVKRKGAIFSVEVSSAVGRNQQHRTGTRFMINFSERNIYSSTKTYKNGNPLKIDKKEYAISLVNNAQIARCFSNVYYNAHDPFRVIFNIKEEYRKFFRPGEHIK